MIFKGLHHNGLSLPRFRKRRHRFLRGLSSAAVRPCAEHPDDHTGRETPRAAHLPSSSTMARSWPSSRRTDRPSSSKDKHDFDLHIALEVEPRHARRYARPGQGPKAARCAAPRTTTSHPLALFSFSAPRSHGRCDRAHPNRQVRGASESAMESEQNHAR